MNRQVPHAVTKVQDIVIRRYETRGPVADDLDLSQSSIAGHDTGTDYMEYLADTADTDAWLAPW